jgi:hypothetical protein
MKFETEGLVTEMLDQLPQTVWTDPTATFLDPAIGGGQFVREIERRLRAAGHSDVSIASRVFGFEESMLHIRFAVNKYKLTGSYIKKSYEDFFNMTGMKFDVIVGNPPYNDNNQGFWKEFAIKSMELVKPNGFVGLVTPNSWANGSHLNKPKNIFNSIFQKYQTVVISTDVNSHFPKIGKNISYWIVQNTKPTTVTRVISPAETVDVELKNYPFFINEFSAKGLSVFEKVLAKKSFWKEFKERPSKHPKEFGFPKAKHTSYKHGYKYGSITHNFPTSRAIVGIDCTNYKLEEVKNIEAQFDTSLFKFLWRIYGAHDAGSVGWILRCMPKLSVKETWDDAKIAKHFGFTKDEQEYICR